MQVFKNADWKGRDYEMTNVIACVAEFPPEGNWTPADRSALDGLTLLWIQAGVEFWGLL